MNKYITEKWRWLAGYVAMNIATFSVAFGWVQFGGLVWVDIVVAGFIATAFVFLNIQDTRMRDERPRQGKIKHRDGSKTKIYFIASDEPDEFLAVTRDGKTAIMHEGDQLEVDMIMPRQRVRIDKLRRARDED